MGQDVPQISFGPINDWGQTFADNFTGIFNNMQRLKYQQAKDLIDQEMSQAQLDETERYHTGVLSHQKEQDAIGNRRADEQVIRDMMASISAAQREKVQGLSQAGRDYTNMTGPNSMMDIRTAVKGAYGPYLSPEEVQQKTDEYMRGAGYGQVPSVQGSLPPSTVPPNLPPEVAANIQGANQQAVPVSTEPTPYPAMGEALTKGASVALGNKESLIAQHKARTAYIAWQQLHGDRVDELNAQKFDAKKVHDTILNVDREARLELAKKNSEFMKKYRVDMTNIASLNASAHWIAANAFAQSVPLRDRQFMYTVVNDEAKRNHDEVKLYEKDYNDAKERRSLNSALRSILLDAGADDPAHKDYNAYLKAQADYQGALHDAADYKNKMDAAQKKADELDKSAQNVQATYKQQQKNNGMQVPIPTFNMLQKGAVSPGKNGTLPSVGGMGIAKGGPALKTLDRSTAMSLLKEAGGDKDKARQLAKQRGYQF